MRCRSVDQYGDIKLLVQTTVSLHCISCCSSGWKGFTICLAKVLTTRSRRSVEAISCFGSFQYPPSQWTANSSGDGGGTFGASACRPAPSCTVPDYWNHKCLQWTHANEKKPNSIRVPEILLASISGLAEAIFTATLPLNQCRQVECKWQL